MSSAHIAHIRRSMRHACHGRQAAATRAGHRSWPSLRRAGSVRRTVVSVAAKMRNGVPVRERIHIMRRVDATEPAGKRKNGEKGETVQPQPTRQPCHGTRTHAIMARFLH
jgi:hypothetical protein